MTQTNRDTWFHNRGRLLQLFKTSMLRRLRRVNLSWPPAATASTSTWADTGRKTAYNYSAALTSRHTLTLPATDPGLYRGQIQITKRFVFIGFKTCFLMFVCKLHTNRKSPQLSLCLSPSFSCLCFYCAATWGRRCCWSSSSPCG